MSLFSAEVGPQLRQHQRLLDWPIQVGHQQRVLGDLSKDPDFCLDAYQCAKIIRDRSHDIFSTPGAKHTAQRLARELLALRNAHAHGEDISLPDASRGSRLVKGLLEVFGLPDAASLAADLALPPSIAYVAELRAVLVDAAEKKAVVTYDEVLGRLGLPGDDLGHRVLYRQLNVLAAKQLILDEPQLCAVVVLASGQIPGNGFYWVVDVDRDADVVTKQAAHAEALNRVFAHRW